MAQRRDEEYEDEPVVDDFLHRVPPHELTGEAAVLSAILLRPDCAAEAFAIVHPDQFYSDANKQIGLALLELFQQNAAIDILTVRSWLEKRGKLQRVGGARYLAEILDCVPAITNVATYAEMVRDAWRKRQLITTCHLYAAQGYTHAGPAQDLVEDAENAIAAIARDETDAGFTVLKDAVSDAFHQIEIAARNGQGRTGAPTGMAKLDKLTGGWQATDLIIVAARPGMGKTAFALHQAVVVGQYSGSVFGEDPAPGGVASLFFSLEMPKAQLAMRMICTEAECDLAKVRSGTVPKSYWDRLTPASARLHSVRMYIDDHTGVPVLQLRSKVLRQKMELERKGIRLGLVCVDYLQKMTTRDPVVHSRAEVVGSIARSLKDVARDANVPVMALSQLNRSMEQGNRRPVLSDLRESGDIEQEADVVAFLYDPNGGDSKSEARTDKDSDDAQELELIVAKQRNGPVGTVKLGFVRRFTKFGELADDSSP